MSCLLTVILTKQWKVHSMQSTSIVASAAPQEADFLSNKGFKKNLLNGSLQKQNNEKWATQWMNPPNKARKFLKNNLIKSCIMSPLANAKALSWSQAGNARVLRATSSNQPSLMACETKWPLPGMKSLAQWSAFCPSRTLTKWLLVLTILSTALQQVFGQRTLIRRTITLQR